MNDVIPGSSGGQSGICNLVDHIESYGPHIIKYFVEKASPYENVVDLGAGKGRDLAIAKSACSSARTTGIEICEEYLDELKEKVDEVVTVDIERGIFPFADQSVDVFIANQVLEHTKELYWIFHEITRSLRIGGYCIIGVPNITSLHNRIMLALGLHPSTHKSYSAHIRIFSKKDLIRFMNTCFPDGYKLVGFSGSQFYPFPPGLARILAKLFPQMAYSIFFMFKKTKKYDKQFLEHPVKASLETNFYLGP